MFISEILLVGVDREGLAMKFEHEIEIESYEQKLDRWRDGWRREIDDDLDHGR